MEALTLQDIQSIRSTVPPIYSGWVYVSSLAMKTYKKTPLLKRWCEVRHSEDPTVKDDTLEFYRNIDDWEPTKRIHLSYARVVVSRGSKLTQAQLAKMNKASNTVAFYIDFPKLKKTEIRPISPFIETRSVRADLNETAETFPLGFIMVSADPSASKQWENVLVEGCKVSLPREKKRVRVQRWINRAWLRLRGDLSIDQFDESFRPASIDTEVAENFFSVTSDDKELRANLVRLASQESSDDEGTSEKSFQTADHDSDEDIEREVLSRRDSTEVSQFQSVEGGNGIFNEGSFMSVDEMFAEKNDEIRHLTKISDLEIRSVISYVEGTRWFSEATPDKLPAGWSICSQGDSFDTFKSIDESSGVVRTRTWAKIAGVPPHTLFYILYKNSARKSWDHHYARFETEWVDPADPTLDIIDAVVAAPFGCANREFLEWRKRSVPEPNRPERSGKFVIYLRSWSPMGGRPVGKGCVRAEVWLSGYLIQWWTDPTTGSVLGSDVMVMTQIDIKGLIPKYIVNALSSSAPRKWVKGVTTAAIAELDKRGFKDGSAIKLSDTELDNMYKV